MSVYYEVLPLFFYNRLETKKQEGRPQGDKKLFSFLIRMLFDF